MAKDKKQFFSKPKQFFDKPKRALQKVGNFLQDVRLRKPKDESWFMFVTVHLFLIFLFSGYAA